MPSTPELLVGIDRDGARQRVVARHERRELLDARGQPIEVGGPQIDHDHVVHRDERRGVRDVPERVCRPGRDLAQHDHSPRGGTRRVVIDERDLARAAGEREQRQPSELDVALAHELPGDARAARVAPRVGACVEHRCVPLRRSVGCDGLRLAAREHA
jgi:hypothetical protein